MKIYQLYFLIGLSYLLLGCGKRTPEEGGNGIYYWKTTYKLSNEEQWFLNEHEIHRMYIRFFDVVLDNWKIVPNATIQFTQAPLNDMEYIPTVFITNEAMLEMKGEEAKYAQLITKRIHAMIMKNKIEKVHEVQLDCDWTPSSQDSFFLLCDKIRNELHLKGYQLSATIRLHQLRQEKPPVDKGVLMVYNTGSIRNPTTVNSILDLTDVKHYLSSIKKQIPMDFAFPTFSWSVWFREDQFMAIIRQSDFSDDNLYENLGYGLYKVLSNHVLENHYLNEGDIIRLEHPYYKDIMKVKEAVEHAFNSDRKHHSIILYHLDYTNLSKYSSNEIEKIYR